MKTLTLSAIALTVFAGMASAATNAELSRFGVDADDLTPQQVQQIERAIAGADNTGEVRALVRSIVNNG